MKYIIEHYKNCKRFNEQYEEIYRFLLEAQKMEYNEHFHWGRFEWMNLHSMLDEDKLTQITMFKNDNDKIVGMLFYDTSYDDRTYIIYTVPDKELLNQMVDTICEREGHRAVIKVNSKDTVLCEILQEKQFVKKCKDVSVLELDLSKEMEYKIPNKYTLTSQGFVVDNWKYQLVIHRGFDGEDMPDMWSDELFGYFARTISKDIVIQTFAIEKDEYCAHCGLWYSEGDTSYIEPVVTVPKDRGQGLAKAVVYESCNRAGSRGAKRAIVLSDQTFYYKIGFECSSEVYCWEKMEEIQ